jgi:hypothetical protein
VVETTNLDFTPTAEERRCLLLADSAAPIDWLARYELVSRGEGVIVRVARSVEFVMLTLALLEPVLSRRQALTVVVGLRAHMRPLKQLAAAMADELSEEETEIASFQRSLSRLTDVVLTRLA